MNFGLDGKLMQDFMISGDSGASQYTHTGQAPAWRATPVICDNELLVGQAIACTGRASRRWVCAMKKSLGLLAALSLFAANGTIINFDTAPLGQIPPGWSASAHWAILKDQ